MSDRQGLSFPWISFALFEIGLIWVTFGKYGFWWSVWYFFMWPWYLGYKLAQWAI